MNALSLQIGNWLKIQPTRVFALYAIVAAFGSYFSMYAFRKPFAAGSYSEVEAVNIFGLIIGYKTILVIAQVFGYCISKFIGIKLVSELPAEKRAIGIALLIGSAWFSLFLFALVPPPWNVVCLFLNGLPLGMIWGLVFGFLEGRRISEVLGVGLSASYILASGVVKGVGKWLINLGVSEFWMPFATGAIFISPIIIFVFLLSSLPPPSEEDIAHRTRRAPMDSAARQRFFFRYFPGLLPLTLLYIVLTAYRDFRDNFSVEIWEELGYSEQEAARMLAGSELPVTLGVLGVLALLVFIRNNRQAVLTIHMIMMAGTALVGISTLLFQAEMIGPATWMILIGLGLYAAYVPYGCILFDRMIAMLGAVATAGFLIYFTDAFGYLGAVGLMLFRDVGHPELSWLEFFTGASYATSIICTGLFLFSFLYFKRLKVR